MFAWLLVLLLCVHKIVAQADWIVNIESGSIRGFWSDQFGVWSFRGIPYAAPPLGELRFKAPIPHNPWDGILNATNDNTICIQNPIADSVITEDCLVINVFVPELTSSLSSLPVLFFIHGGSLTYGNGNHYNPHWTTRHDVILVTFNYRIGPIGYMCLGNEKIPGNAGLKDILAALRWTNNNIASFGGDPEAITIYGESAGGLQCQALMLSEAAAGLFKRAIVESGSVLRPFYSSYSRLGVAKAVAHKSGFLYLDDLDALAMFFQNLSSEELFLHNSLVEGVHDICVEKQVEGVESVITDILPNKLASGNYNKAPVMFAYAELDGLSYATDFYDRIEELTNSFENFLPFDLIFPNEAEKQAAAQKLKDTYFGAEQITNSSLINYIEFITDLKFVAPIIRSSLLHAANNNQVYLMEFSYWGGYNQPSPYDINIASHADIVAHVLDLGYYNNETLEQDQSVRDVMTELFTNFVKYGNPTPTSSSLGVQWLPFTEEEQNYLNVGTDLTLRQTPKQNRTAIWIEIYEKYFYPPILF